MTWKLFLHYWLVPSLQWRHNECDGVSNHQQLGRLICPEGRVSWLKQMQSNPIQITSLTSVYSTVYSGAGQRKHQSSASLTFVRGIHQWPVNSPHKGPVTRKTFPFDNVIMSRGIQSVRWIPLQKVSNAELWGFLCFQLEKLWNYQV